MPRWAKFVALFLLVFALVDVCTPEACADEAIALPAQSAIEVHATQTNPDNGRTCEFEEDCFACAHFVPAVHISFHIESIVATYEPTLVLPALDGTPSAPYHPPRT